MGLAVSIISTTNMDQSPIPLYLSQLCKKTFYVFDGVLNEEGCLSMIDITADGWTPCLVLVTWRFLGLIHFKPGTCQILRTQVHLGYIRIAAIVLLMGVGYYIFSASSNQKSAFKPGKIRPHEKHKDEKRTLQIALRRLVGNVSTPI